MNYTMSDLPLRTVISKRPSTATARKGLTERNHSNTIQRIPSKGNSRADSTTSLKMKNNKITFAYKPI